MSRKHPTKMSKTQSIFIKASAANTGGPNYPASASAGLIVSPVKASAKSRSISPRKAKVKPHRASLGEGTPRGFAFAVKAGDKDVTKSEWTFVTLEYGNRLSTTPIPYNVFPEVTNDLAEMWRMIVFDRAYYFDEKYIHIETLKLVELFIGVRDVSERLFIDEEGYRDNRKLAALSKLSAQEATLLGLENEYVMLMMMKNRPDENRAQNLLKKLNETQTPVEAANI